MKRCLQRHDRRTTRSRQAKAKRRAIRRGNFDPAGVGREIRRMRLVDAGAGKSMQMLDNLVPVLARGSAEERRVPVECTCTPRVNHGPHWVVQRVEPPAPKMPPGMLPGQRGVLTRGEA